jgi:hypothetical protein
LINAEASLAAYDCVVSVVLDGKGRSSDLYPFGFSDSLDINDRVFRESPELRLSLHRARFDCLSDKLVIDTRESIQGTDSFRSQHSLVPNVA